jgi:hypothetical protein
VTGEILNAELQSIILSSSGRSLHTDVAFDGSFAFQDVPPGSYTVMSSNSPPQFLWACRQVEVVNRDITGIAVSSPGESLRVMGRVVIEGGGPAPSFVFALQGSRGFARDGYIWANDTLRSNPVVGMTGWADSYDDVIFNVLLPIGQYRIVPSGLPPGYRVKSFTYGRTNLLKSPINVTGQLRQLSIVLSPSPDFRIRKIRGRFIRDVSLPVDVRTSIVRLASRLLLTEFDVPVAGDGAFEISGVAQGDYGLSVGGLSWRLEVPERGVEGLAFRASQILARREDLFRRSPYLWGSPTIAPGPETVLPQRELQGSVDVSDGSSLSDVYLSLKSTSGFESRIGLNDASFTQQLPKGTYRVGVLGLNDRFEVLSLTYGSVDLRKEPLRITADSSSTLKLSLGVKPVRRVKVSGRVVGTRNAEILSRAQVVLSGALHHQTSVDRDGRFTLKDVPSDTYLVYNSTNSSVYRGEARVSTVVVRDADVDGVEVPALPAPMKSVRGRIVVEGDVPRPVVALTVRPNIDAGPPYVHPYTRKSNDPEARFNIQSDGYFTLDLPEGRHRLRIDGFPDSLYRLKSVQYGSENLKDGLLQIGGGNPKEILITFTSMPDSSWTSVKGRVTGIENVSEPLRVVLLGSARGFVSKRVRLPMARLNLPESLQTSTAY